MLPRPSSNSELLHTLFYSPHIFYIFRSSNLDFCEIVNLLFEWTRRSVTEEKDRVSFRLQSVQEDIRKLLRARGSVEQLQSLLKEKGVSIGTGSRLKSITTSTKSILKVKKGSASPKISPRISNLDRSATPTKKEIQVQNLTPRGCPRTNRFSLMFHH